MKKISLTVLLVLIVLMPAQLFSQIYASSLDKIPKGWKGPVFSLSRDYPKRLPVEKNMPWLKYDFKKQPKEYMNAVLAYFLEGNVEANWVVQNNKIRKWYHAPSMSWQPAKRPFGREFIHGLTRERNSPPQELYPGQADLVQNWAVGFYNPLGAYTFGQVWADTNNLNTANAKFSEGTVAAKLLFTAANPDVVPYVKGSLEWQANISTAPSARDTTRRSPQTVRLLQLDIAIKDSRANSLTGWVFGTFAYNAGAKGTTIWQKLVPVGLMWGNDPGQLNGGQIEETWINPEFKTLFKFPDGTTMHLGYEGRLNGPVDNKVSSCLSCHSTAQIPQYTNMIPDTSKASMGLFFRNVKSGEPFDGKPTSNSLDYSLQMSGGVAAAMANNRSLLSSKKLNAQEVKAIGYFVTSMEDTAGRHAIDTTAFTHYEMCESENEGDEQVCGRGHNNGEHGYAVHAVKLVLALTAVIALLLFIWKYLSYRRRALDEQVNESKRVAYGDFLRSFKATVENVRYDNNTGREMIRFFAADQLLLHGSDEVIRAYYAWEEYAYGEKNLTPAKAELFDALLMEMRKDVNRHSQLGKKEMSAFNPFRRRGPLT